MLYLHEKEETEKRVERCKCLFSRKIDVTQNESVLYQFSSSIYDYVEPVGCLQYQIMVLYESKFIYETIFYLFTLLCKKLLGYQEK